jgi:hypothetical protein
VARSVQGQLERHWTGGHFLSAYEQ